MQSVYLGHIPKQDFGQYITHLDFSITDNVIDNCLIDIKAIIKIWEQLAVGEQLRLQFNLKNEKGTTNR